MSGVRRVFEWLPEPPVERLRWAKLGLDLTLALAVVAALADRPDASPVTVMALAAVAGTAALWVRSVRRGDMGAGTDAFAVAAILLLGLAMRPTEPGTPFVFAAITMRALYPGKLARALVLYPLALATGWLAAWGLEAFQSLSTLLTLAGFVVAGLAFRIVVGALMEHESTREQLREARDALERRVEERTRDLAASNEQLERKIREVSATQKLLGRSEEYYRALIENGSDIVVVLRPDGRIRYASPSVERNLGYAADEVWDKGFVEFLVEDCIPDTLEVFNEVLEQPGRTAVLTVQVRHADGGVRHLEAVARNQVETESVAGVVFSARDVTERVSMEAALRDQEVQLRQAQKMEAVGRLAGGVAHDFNNILTIIGGHAEYLCHRVPDDDPLREEAEAINETVDRAGRLTRQLLMFSRREVARPRVVALNEVVKGVEGMVRRLLPETVELRTELRAPQGWVMADPGHLEQVVLNLVLNARDAMPDGGRVMIRTEPETVECVMATRFGDIDPGEYVRLAVADSGCGIPPEIVDRVFEPFFTTKGAGGTGLGLSTVFGIARDAGAGIRVKTELGRGSCFDLLFPLSAEAPADAEGGITQEPDRPTGETLLLVEDEDALRSLSARGLREHGYVVLSAANAEDALRIVELYQEPIDLLVSDVVMPGLNGPGLHRELEDRLGRLPVLFVSGYPGEELSRRGLEEGRLLPKPYTALELARTVREVLDEG